jgi:hypothetical protein
MGTSMSQRSPSTTNWRAVDTAYQNPDVSIERTVQEIWRASANDNKGLANSLGEKIVAQSIEIVRNAQSSAEAAQQIRRLVAFSGNASLAADIAQEQQFYPLGIKIELRTLFVLFLQKQVIT